jgi:DNA-directed RNA polymerase subunit M/transcription elongation factor TFIIS
MSKPFGGLRLRDDHYRSINLTNPRQFKKYVDPIGQVKCPHCGSVELDVQQTFIQIGFLEDRISEYCVCTSCDWRYRIYSEGPITPTPMPDIE